MPYRIQAIELYLRETPPNRVPMSIGRMGAQGTRDISPLAHVRMVVRDGEGQETFGCAADRLSVRWLDKRPKRTKARKLRELVRLVYGARQVYLDKPSFDDPFAKWRSCYRRIKQAGDEQGQEALTSSFASALFERAMLDAVSRLAGKSIYEMVREGRLGFRPGAIHTELDGLTPTDYTAPEPLTAFHIRHTVGIRTPSPPPTSRQRPESTTDCRKRSRSTSAKTGCITSSSSSRASAGTTCGEWRASGKYCPWTAVRSSPWTPMKPTSTSTSSKPSCAISSNSSSACSSTCFGSSSRCRAA